MVTAASLCCGSGGGRLKGGGGGGGPIGGGFPAEEGSRGAGRVADGSDAASTPGERRVSLALSARRARLASRARLSSSPRRRASITAVPAGSDGLMGDRTGGVALPGREAAVRG